MPRKCSRASLLLKYQPITFSPFGRVASAYKPKCYMHHPSLERKSRPHPAGNGYMRHGLEEKSERAESSDEELSEGVVQADFAFFDPKPDDFHGVKILLQTYLEDTQWDLSGFVDLILGQSTVGTVVKIEDAEDDGIFCFITVLNLGRYKTHKCIMEVKDFLLKVSLNKDVAEDLRLLLGKQAHHVGLLVSQRISNLPPQLLPPLYDAIFDEISWATEDEPTEERRDSFRFKVYLLVSKILKHKNADRKKGRSCCNDESIIYFKAEDEIFHKLSMWSFCFSLHKQQLASTEHRNHRLMGLVMAVEADKISTFRQQLRSLIDEP